MIMQVRADYMLWVSHLAAFMFARQRGWLSHCRSRARYPAAVSLGLSKWTRYVDCSSASPVARSPFQVHTTVIVKPLIEAFTIPLRFERRHDRGGRRAI